MTLDEQLRLVLPVGDGERFLYHVPIDESIFQLHFRVLAATKAAIWGKGLAYAADVGPQIASMVLRDEGELIARDRLEKGDHGASALLAEIKRLTTVVAPSEEGYQTLPVDKALGDEDWRELESRIVFFTCLYALTPRRSRREIAQAVAGILNALVTALPSTAAHDFIAQWTEDQDSKKAASSEPASGGEPGRGSEK